MFQKGIQKKQGSIVEVLKDGILSGEIPSGTEMTQNELAQSLGVSRMPVREALIILEYQGLIERLANNHVRVADFGERCFHETFSLCMQWEEETLKTMQGTDWENDPAEYKKSALLGTEIPEELLLHARICGMISNAFLKKTLQTIIEIYVDFAVRCPGYDRQKGYERLKEACLAPDKERRGLLQQYFAELEKTIAEERKKKCSN